MAAESVGQIGLDLVVNKNKFDRQMKGITGTAKKAAATIAGVFAVKKIFDFGKAAVNLGSDLAEVQNVVDVTFSSMSSQVNQFAQDAAASFGLSETMAKKYVGTFGAMSKAFGFSEQQAYNMSTALTGLSGDVASFYNISQDEAYTKLKSVFTGETETLKDLGVVMTQNALDSYAMANGYGKVTAKMTEAEKVALRFAFVQDQLSLANGDFARTSDSWANQVRVLKLQMESFMATVGQGLINIFTPAIKIINVLMQKLISLANIFKAFTQALFGSKDGADGVAKSTASAAGGLTSAGDAAEEAGEEAKKSEKEFASFDQLNVLGQSSKTTDKTDENIDVGVNFDVAGLQKAESDATDELTPFVQKVQTLLKPLQEISFDKLSESFGRLKQALAPFGKAIGAGLEWLYKNVLVPLAKWVIEEYLPVWLGNLSATLNVLSAIIEAFKPVFLWLWNSFLVPIAKWTGEVIVKWLELTTEALNKVAEWIRSNKGIVVGITVAIGAFFAAWKAVELMSFIAQAGGVAAAFKLMTGGILGTVAAKIKDKIETMYLHVLYAGDFLRSIKGIIVQKAKEVAAWAAVVAAKIKDKAETLYLKALYLGDLVKGMAATIAVKAKEAAAWVVTTAAKVKDKIATVALTVATTAHTVAVGIATAATTAFSTAMAFLAANPIVLVIAGIAALIAGIVLLVKNWDTVKEKAAEVWDSIKAIWGSIKDWFASNIANPILSITEKVINGIISGINRGIKALNKIKIDVPDWIPGIGGKGFGFNFKEIGQVALPRLATGAVIPPNSEFLAVLGDQKRGTNIEAPLSTIEQALRNVLRERGNTGGGNVTVQMVVDGRELARVTAPYNAGEQNRRGVRLINGTV